MQDIIIQPIVLAVRLLPADVSHSGGSSIRQDSTRVGERRGAPAALLMFIARPSYR